jgi:hypothetical protein
MLYATTRSGSNYLHSCFNNYTKYTWHNVPFDFRQYTDNTLAEYKVIQQESNIQTEQLNNIIWKIHPTDISEKRMLCNYQKEIHDMINIPDYVIALTRRNLIQSALSQMIGRTTKVWNYPYTYEQVTITDIVMREVCDNILYYHLYEFINNIHHVSVNEIVFFEDLTFNEITDLDKLQLDIDIVDTADKITIKKTPSKSDVIVNYDEVYTYITNYFKYISNDYFLVEDGYLVGMDYSNLAK